MDTLGTKHFVLSKEVVEVIVFTFRDFEFVGVHIVTSNWSVISKHVTLATTLEPLNSGHTGDQAFCP